MKLTEQEIKEVAVEVKKLMDAPKVQKLKVDEASNSPLTEPKINELPELL